MSDDELKPTEGVEPEAAEEEGEEEGEEESEAEGEPVAA